MGASIEENIQHATCNMPLLLCFGIQDLQSFDDDDDDDAQTTLGGKPHTLS